MNTPHSRLLAVFLTLGGTAGLVTHAHSVQQRAELARHTTALAQRESELHRTRQELASLNAEFDELRRRTDAAHLAAATRELSPVHLWASRVLLMRQLLDEMPAQRLPELKLLTLLDWIQVARHAELDTANRIRTALGGLRAVARRRFAAALQTALTAFTTATRGELPTDILQLAPHLPAPADAAMLARYELIRTGRLGADSEHLIRERPGSDAVLLVSLTGFSVNASGDLDAIFDGNIPDAAERLGGMLTQATDLDPTKAAALVEDLGQFTVALPAVVERLGPEIERAFGGEDAFNALMKQTGMRFRAAHPDTTETTFDALLPFFPEPDKLRALVRLGFAQIEHYAKHRELAADAAALAPFLARPFDTAAALRSLKVKLTEENYTVEFAWTRSDLANGFSPAKP